MREIYCFGIVSAVSGILLIGCLLFSCHEKKDALRVPLADATDQSQIDSIGSAQYYGYDTLLLKAYLSDNGNEIMLRGSRSGFLFRVSVRPKGGRLRDYDITTQPYIANHSILLWDNDDLILIRYGCGSPCWAAKILTLKGKKEMKDYLMYLYEDSVHNLIVYPDSVNWNTLILEDLLTGTKKSEQLDLCQKTNFVHYMIDTIIYRDPRSVTVRYRGSDCESVKTKEISLE